MAPDSDCNDIRHTRELAQKLWSQCKIMVTHNLFELNEEQVAIRKVHIMLWPLT